MTSGILSHADTLASAVFTACIYETAVIAKFILVAVDKASHHMTSIMNVLS